MKYAIVYDCFLGDEERSRAANEAKHLKLRDAVDVEEQEEIDRILEDENIKLLDDKDRESVTFLDALTGIPREDDVIHFAMAVCAPLSAMSNYKYRVKMLPGTSRKGQATKHAMHIFQSKSNITAREKELMKVLKVCCAWLRLPAPHARVG